MTEARAPTHPEDLALVRDALAGSLPARRQFARRMRCVPRMLSVICSRLAHPLPREDQEDLVQDTLVAIWRRLESYQGMAALETWAYRFCRLQLANRLRSRSRRPAHVPVDGQDPTDDRIEAFLDFEDLHRALERVGTRDARVIHLKHFGQLSFDEIGARLAISPNTAKSRYYRGLDRLRELLQPMPGPLHGPMPGETEL